MFYACSYGKAPHGSQRTGFLLLGRPFLKAETPSPRMFMRIIVRMCPTNMRVFCRLLEDIEQL